MGKRTSGLHDAAQGRAEATGEAALFAEVYAYAFR